MSEANEISREALNALPIRRWEGAVHVLASAGELKIFEEEIRGETVVGLDTETRPAFRVGESYKPSLVQVAAARAVYLLPVQRLDCSAPLRALLADPGIVKAGVSVADDLYKLRQLFAFDEASIVDVGKLARARGIRQSGVRNLAGLLLGFRIPKGNRTSNWASPRLSPQQIAYAATDAWVCRELYNYFTQENT